MQMFKEFNLSMFFDISTTKSVDKNKLDFVADGEYDFIGRTSVNWGIQGRLHKLSFEPNPKDSFSLVQVGETVALWREKEWYASQNIFLLNPKINEIKENKLYFQGVINKEMSRYGKEYSSYPTMKSLEATKILLPVVESPEPGHEYTVDDIDWQYMRKCIAELEQRRIAELEQRRIAELDAYLVASGLDDYELTDEDKEMLSSSTMQMFKEFAVKDVLNVEQTKSVVAKADLTEGDIPYVTRTVSDNGYMGTCGNTDKVNKGNCITIGAETGVAFYQPNDFVAGNKVYRLSREGLNIKEYLFLASILNMQTKNYSYSNARIPEKIKVERILLPVIKSSDPGHEYTAEDIDFDYIERYIRATEKSVIADVVRYKNAVIAATKKIVDAK